MEDFIFEAKGTFLQIKVKNNNITFKPSSKKVALLLKNDLCKSITFKLDEPDKIKDWISKLSNLIGAEETVLEIFSLKFQPLEDMIDNLTLTKVLRPSLFDADYGRKHVGELEADDYFNFLGDE